MGYSWQDAYVAMKKESTFRNGDAALTTPLRGIEILSDEIDVPDPKVILEELYALGGGRNITHLIYKGFEEGGGGVPAKMVSGIPLYFALGGCATTSPSNYLHTFSQESTLPSFGLHVENEKTSEDLRVDILGCFISSLNIANEQKGLVELEEEIIGCKAVAGSDLAKPDDIGTVLTSPPFGWQHLDSSNCYLKLAGTPVETSILDRIDSININISNVWELRTPGGEENAKTLVIGEQIFEITLHYYPTNRDIYDLAREGFPYAGGDLSFGVRWARDTDDFVDFQLSKVYVDPNYPLKVPNIAAKEVGVQLKLKAAPGVALTSSAQDDLAANYYETVPT